jgi:phosphatidylglycerophosphate synthase
MPPVKAVLDNMLYTWPGRISLLRLVMGILVAVFAGVSGAVAALVFVLACQVSDPLDGYVARQMGIAAKENEPGDLADLAGDMSLFVGALVGLAILGTITSARVFGLGEVLSTAIAVVVVGLIVAAVGQAIYLTTKIPVVFAGSVVLQGVFAFLFMNEAGVPLLIIPYGVAFGVWVWAIGVDRLKQVLVLGSVMVFAPAALALLA